MTLIQIASALPRWQQIALAIIFVVFGSLFLSQTRDMSLELFRVFGLVWVVLWVIVLARAYRSHQPKRQLKMVGAALVAVPGLLALLAPTFTGVVALSILFFLLAGTAIAVGIVTIWDVASETARPPNSRRWLRVGLGILEIIAGLFFFFHPMFLSNIMISVLGAVMIATAILLVAVAVRDQFQLKAARALPPRR
ncbi:MAG: hypothetical protein HDKAJFGB_00926 [Anaerolineae bacterium]|nr:hypothetical protein [Anaerolineae bacterium]